MVPPIVLLYHLVVALVVSLNAVNPLPMARDMVRVQLQYIANAPALFTHILIDSPQSPNRCFGFCGPLFHYSPPSVLLLSAPPTRTLPGTPTTSSTDRIEIVSTAISHTAPARAPEGTPFSPAELILSSAKQLCPSFDTVVATIDVVRFALSLFAVRSLLQLLVLTFSLCAHFLRQLFFPIPVPAALSVPQSSSEHIAPDAELPRVRTRRQIRHGEKNRSRLRRERKARSVAAAAAAQE